MNVQKIMYMLNALQNVSTSDKTFAPLVTTTCNECAYSEHYNAKRMGLLNNTRKASEVPERKKLRKVENLRKLPSSSNTKH